MRRGGMNVQFAEPSSECEMLLRADVLIAEEDHEIFGERAMDLVHLAVGARILRNQITDIDPGYLCADNRREFLDRVGLVGFLFARRVAIAWALFAGERVHERPPAKALVS